MRKVNYAKRDQAPDMSPFWESVDVQEKLLLLVPRDLCSSYELSESSKSKLCIVFNQLLQCLNQTCLEQASSIINQTLEILGPVEVCHPKRLADGTSLETWEVEDSDSYFNVRHVQAKEPAECLIGSFLKAYQNWLELNKHCLSLDPLKMEQVKSGFKSYIYLLSRSFGLTLKEIL